MGRSRKRKRPRSSNSRDTRVTRTDAVRPRLELRYDTTYVPLTPEEQFLRTVILERAWTGPSFYTYLTGRHFVDDKGKSTITTTIGLISDLWVIICGYCALNVDEMLHALERSIPDRPGSTSTLVDMSNISESDAIEELVNAWTEEMVRLHSITRPTQYVVDAGDEDFVNEDRFDKFEFIYATVPHAAHSGEKHIKSVRDMIEYQTVEFERLLQKQLCGGIQTATVMSRTKRFVVESLRSIQKCSETLDEAVAMGVIQPFPFVA
jgi:hypothetical protein